MTLPTIVHRIDLRFSLAYIVESDSGLVLVDAGIRGEEHKIMKRITDLDKGELKLIFITHAHLDHYGSAAAIRRTTGAPIAIHQDDEEAMALGETQLGSAKNLGRILAPLLPLATAIRGPEPATADIVFQDGDNLAEYGLNAWILHTPGHTIGSCSLIVDDNLAFVGDLVTNTGRPHLQRSFAHDWSKLRTSLQKLQETKPQWLYPGHGPRPMEGADLENL